MLGQVKCEERSNEITAIPELLQILDLEGCIITIDAIGCQREIVKQIVEKGADYVIALKENQGTLHWAHQRVFGLWQSEADLLKSVLITAKQSKKTTDESKREDVG